MSIEPTFARSEDAKAAGWFSRRHKTDEAFKKQHLKNVEKYKNKQIINRTTHK